MAASAWHLIAQTNEETELHDSYQFKLYQWLLSAHGSVVTLVQKSDYKLRRGKPSAKNKFNYITHTTIDFTIIDENFWLIDKLRSDDEFNFKGVILKNGSTFFAGYLTLKLKDLLYKKTNEAIKITLYDGMKRLQEYDDLTDLGTGLTQMKEVLRELFNKLNLELNINAYQNIYTGFDDSITSAHQLALTYIYPLDYINTLGKRTNLYNFLIALCKTFDWNVFQENGVWVIRQNASIVKTTNLPIDGIWKEVVNYSTGVYSASKVDLDRAISNTDLRADPVVFEMDKIDKVEATITAYRADETPDDDEGTIVDWLNPYFVEGSNGWTTGSGSPDYRDDAAYLDPTEEIHQDFLGLSAGETIVIKLSATCIRMVLNSGDVLLQGFNNPLFKIKYVGTSFTWYLNNSTLNSWTLSAVDADILIGMPMAGMPVAGTYKKIYNKQTFELNLEIACPAQNGTLTIYCYGGGTASGNNYPFEQGAIHNFALVKRKSDADDFPVSVPNKLVLRAEVPNAKELHKYTLPLADYIPYHGVVLWHIEKDTAIPLTEYKRSYNWSPDGGLLIENIAERIINHNANKKGYDLRLVPGTSLNFIDLAQMDLESEGADSYYLPVFEEAYLLKDHRRFVLLKHNYDSLSITTKKEFIFPNTPQQ